MTQISFAKSRYIGDMVEGTKTTTIRRNWERWVKEFEAQHDLHVYYGSRWYGNLVYVGKCKLVSVKVLRGSQFTHEDARADGFDNLVELYDALKVLNDMKLEAVLEHKWAVREMGEWLHGPYWSGEQGALES
jgi:hypothetical protein